ncbi:hypothetical protein ND16A_3614 [Thalassotalea sp. ND16A]|nr:hypothetical protein ND16A_3614 [Thalassotalea sp. ND16A]
MSSKIIIFTFLIISTANAATIKSVRCGQKIIRVGDPVKTVYQNCKRLKTYNNGNIYYKTYGHTPKQFIVRNKKVIKIEELR